MMSTQPDHTEKEQKNKNVVVLGAGNFGTCLAQHLARMGHQVFLWDRQIETIDGINLKRRNPKYLTQYELKPNIMGVHHLPKLSWEEIGFVVVAIPTQAIRTVLKTHKDVFPSGLVWISAAKGMENETFEFPTQIISNELGEKITRHPVCISGPSFAAEVMADQPTAISVASKDVDACKEVQALFHSGPFRAYTTQDVIGLELCGSLKNVIAIASGACSGLGYQENSKAALITRGLAEITRIGVALGADPLTFLGLGGIGDLLLTCGSQKSRNFTLGYRLGRGEKIQEILATVGSVCEGYYTSKAAYDLSHNLKVDAPIADQVYRVLYEAKDIKSAVEDLMRRSPKEERG